MSFASMRYMNPYDIHKTIINTYILNQPGASKAIRRDTSKDKTDFDVLKEHHKFLWDKEAVTWEEKFARKYYDKLFKEYCIGDLSRFKENKIALRWRTEQEVVVGKGQFTCGNKRCTEKDELRSWEVNFSYKEDGEKKNALVKIRLCPMCSQMLNYHSKKREVKRLKKSSQRERRSSKNKKRNRSEGHKPKDSPSTSPESETSGTSSETTSIIDSTEKVDDTTEESPWANLKPPEQKSREEEMDDYLSGLLF